MSRCDWCGKPVTAEPLVLNGAKFCRKLCLNHHSSSLLNRRGPKKYRLKSQKGIPV